MIFLFRCAQQPWPPLGSTPVLFVLTVDQALATPAPTCLGPRPYESVPPFSSPQWPMRLRPMIRPLELGSGLPTQTVRVPPVGSRLQDLRPPYAAQALRSTQLTQLCCVLSWPVPGRLSRRSPSPSPFPCFQGQESFFFPISDHRIRPLSTPPSRNDVISGGVPPLCPVLLCQVQFTSPLFGGVAVRVTLFSFGAYLFNRPKLGVADFPPSGLCSGQSLAMETLYRWLGLVLRGVRSLKLFYPYLTSFAVASPTPIS